MNRQWQVLRGVFIFAMVAVISARGADTFSWYDCIRLAASNNPTLVASRAQVQAAEAGVGSARASQLPQLSAGASADRSHRDSSTTESDTSLGATVSLEQSLYSGGKNAAAVRAARATLDKTSATATNTGAQVTHDLRRAFVNALYSQEQVLLLQAIAKRRSDNLELVDLRYEGGREHKGSLASSQASLFDAQIQVKQAQRLVSVNRNLLARTIGLATIPGEPLVEGVMETGVVPEVSDMEALARTTPAYAASSSARMVAEAQVQQVRGSYRPGLNLVGSAGRSGDEDAFEEDSWSVGLKLSFPFWPGGKNIYEIRKAEAALKEADADLADVLNSRVSTLTETWQSLTNALEEVTVQKKYVEAADIRAEISRQQYEDGLLSFENWVVIEDDLISKRKQLLDAGRSAMFAEAAWWLATGRNIFGEAVESRGAK